MMFVTEYSTRVKKELLQSTAPKIMTPDRSMRLREFNWERKEYVMQLDTSRGV